MDFRFKAYFLKKLIFYDFFRSDSSKIGQIPSNNASKNGKKFKKWEKKPSKRNNDRYKARKRRGGVNRNKSKKRMKKQAKNMKNDLRMLGFIVQAAAGRFL